MNILYIYIYIFFFYENPFLKIKKMKKYLLLSLSYFRKNKKNHLLQQQHYCLIYTKFFSKLDKKFWWYPLNEVDYCGLTSRTAANRLINCPVSFSPLVRMSDMTRKFPGGFVGILRSGKYSSLVLTSVGWISDWFSVNTAEKELQGVQKMIYFPPSPPSKGAISHRVQQIADSRDRHVRPLNFVYRI